MRVKLLRIKSIHYKIPLIYIEVDICWVKNMRRLNAKLSSPLSIDIDNVPGRKLVAMSSGIALLIQSLEAIAISKNILQ